MRTVYTASLLIGMAPHLFGQAGTLDPTFSGDGKHLWDLGSWFDELYAVTVQPDGKVVGAGWIGDGNYADIALQRLQLDGTPDPTWGIGGIVYTPSPADFHYAYAVGVQSTGRVIAAGLAYDGGLDGNGILYGYTPSGAPDATFGSGGLVSTDFGDGFGYQSIYAMRIMPDDRIVVIGQGVQGLVCARFLADGTPDASFGNGGYAYSGTVSSTALCLHLYADGSVIVGGYYASLATDWFLARFDPNGVLDPAFGTNGTLTIDLGGASAESLRGVAVLSDGRIAACGYRSDVGQDDVPVVAMRLPNGTPDLTFGTNGFAEFPYTGQQWGQFWSIIAQPNDALLVSGFRADQSGTPNNDFLLFRLLDDGSLDPSFAGNGQVHTDISADYDRALAMALAPDGSIVLAGFGYASQSATAYARYVNDIGLALPSLPPTEVTMRIHPNPAVDHVRVLLPIAGASSAEYDLTGQDGRTITLGSSQVRSDNGRVLIDLPTELASGLYVLTARTPDGTLRAPLVIDR